MISVRRIAPILVSIVLATVAIISPVSAQSSTISTGVVTDIETADNGNLTAFSILDGDGNVLRFEVSSSNPNTSYGLENRVGERWVADQSSDPREAVIRLQDQQKRLARLSVQSDSNGIALSVVQAESTDVQTNLGYLLAVVAIAWIGIIAYIVYIGVRQRTLEEELAQLDNDNNDDLS